MSAFPFSDDLLPALLARVDLCSWCTDASGEILEVTSDLTVAGPLRVGATMASALEGLEDAVARESILRHLADSAPIAPFVMKVRLHCGSMRALRVSAVVSEATGGHAFLGIWGASSAAGAPDNAETLLCEVVEQMSEGLLVTSGERISDRRNRIELLNPAYLSLFGLTPEQAYVGQAMGEFVDLLAQRGDADENPEVFRETEEKLNRGEEVMLEIPSQNKVYMARSSRRRSGGFVLVHTDVTDLHRHARLLEERKQAAEAATRAKSNFLATMSHEIRTPMNGVVGMADMLADTALDARQRDYVELIRSSADAMTRLITDILDFSRAEAGLLKLEESSFDLTSLVGDVLSLLRPLLRGHPVELRAVTSPDLPQLVHGDPARLRQILVNLVGNAIKFTERGRISLFVSPLPEGGIRFRVTDTGAGIPHDKQALVFEAFEQAEAGLRRRHQGAGLGLAIVRQLVETMGGRLGVTSTPGRGSSFRIELPLMAAAEAPEDLQAPTETRDVKDLMGLRVLVAEDIRTNQLVISHILRHSGAEVEIAANGRLAVEAIRRNRPDLVLMDMSMPEMTGVEAAQMIRSMEAHGQIRSCPIIALTGNAMQQHREACLEAGMNGFLTKPIHKDELLSAVAEAFRDDTVVGRAVP